MSKTGSTVIMVIDWVIFVLSAIGLICILALSSGTTSIKVTGSNSFDFHGKSINNEGGDPLSLDAENKVNTTGDELNSTIGDASSKNESEVGWDGQPRGGDTSPNGTKVEYQLNNNDGSFNFKFGSGSGSTANGGGVQVDTSAFMVAFGVIGGIGLAISLAFNILLTMGLNRESKSYCQSWAIGQGIFLVLNIIATIGLAFGNPSSLLGILGCIYRGVAIYIVREYYRSIQNRSAGIAHMQNPHPHQFDKL